MIAVAERVGQLRQEGKTAAEIVKVLNNEKYQTPNKKSWNKHNYTFWVSRGFEFGAGKDKAKKMPRSTSVLVKNPANHVSSENSSDSQVELTRKILQAQVSPQAKIDALLGLYSINN